MASRKVHTTDTFNADMAKLEEVQATHDQAVHKNKELIHQNNDLRNQVQSLRQKLSLLEKIDSIVVAPPSWTRAPIKKSALYSGTPTLLLSDLHLDEVVNPDEIEGYNAFNREIAVIRLRRTLDKLILVTRQYFSGLKYDGIVIMAAGDTFSGNIQEELQQTNEDTILGSLDFWIDPLAALLEGIVEEYGHVHFAGVPGNHGRNTRKPRAKLRARDNFDWIICRLLARHFAKDSRFTFQIPESADCNVKIYNTDYRLSHGDQFNGGTGIAGMLSPLLLGAYRKARRQTEMKSPFDWMVVGHWHDWWMGKGVIVNGALKGYDEYAYQKNFQPQPPIQGMWVTTPEHGATFPAPLFVGDRKKEGW